MGSAIRSDETHTPEAALAGTVRADGDTVRAQGGDAPRAAYYLLWRTGHAHPWHSEEFASRREAHRRFFELLERGAEAYLEKRPAARSA
jgi:hypothetical protein